MGPEQEKLDNLVGAVVEVTALAPPIQAVPHVELLCYRGNFDRRELLTNRNDVAATQLVFEVEPDALDAIVALNRDTTISSSTTSESGGLRAYCGSGRSLALFRGRYKAAVNHQQKSP